MLIGRKEEQKRLLEAYHSDYSEFVAVYGRRRVGKTFLIRETFDYKFTFTHTGVSKKNTRGQLQEFYLSLKRQGGEKFSVPTNWIEAFDQLSILLDHSNEKRKVVFIDEMPWMDAPRSGFISALEHFCLLHTQQIKENLGISGIFANVYSWHITPSDGNSGAQIDLLIDRADGVVDICEMKYAQLPYTITSNYRSNLLNKMQRFIESTGTKKAVHIVLITANGLSKNTYSDIIHNEITLDDLFNA